MAALDNAPEHDLCSRALGKTVGTGGISQPVRREISWIAGDPEGQRVRLGGDEFSSKFARASRAVTQAVMLFALEGDRQRGRVEELQLQLSRRSPVRIGLKRCAAALELRG